MYNCRVCSAELLVGFNWYTKGLTYSNFICNACRKIYYQANKEKIALQSKVWRDNNKSYRQEYSKKYRELNKDKAKAACLKYNYNISLENYNQLLKLQDYSCAICSTKTPGGRGNSFHVDHDHATGIIRGLLCHHCNTALGKFKDSTVILNKAISYLENKKYG